jgi:hypothetical protein
MDDSFELFTIQNKELSEEPVLVPKPIVERERAEIPIRWEDADRFREWFCQSPEDELLFQKLMSHIRMISKEEISEAAQMLSREIIDFVGSEEYDLVVDREGKSGDLMLENLNITSGDEVHIHRYGSIEARSYARPIDRKVVIADDAAYSSERLLMMVTEAVHAFSAKPEQICICMIGTTSHAEKAMRAKGYQNLKFIYQIPTFEEEFTQEEIDRYIAKMDEAGMGLDPDGYLTRVLTFLETKVPDNFLPGFRRSKSVLLFSDDSDKVEQLYVVDDTESGIWPAYRKK